MTFGTPKRKSGLPAPGSGILSARKSKLQTPQSRRRLQLPSSKKKSILRSGSSGAGGPDASRADTPNNGNDEATLEAAKKLLGDDSDDSVEDWDQERIRSKAEEVLKLASRQSSRVSASTVGPTEGEAGAGEAVKVGVRIRPLLDEDNEPRAFVLGAAENTIVRKIGADNTTYKYNHAYGEDSTTQQLYDDMVSDIVESVVHQGRNGTVFTYGQTSTGKTHTMHGLLAAAGKDLFQEEMEGDDFEIRVAVSCMELYNEELRDLLCDSMAPLSIQEDRQGNVLIPGVTETLVWNIDELMDVIESADEKRTIGSTAMNERSSRSHTIFRVTYTKTENGVVGCSLDESGDEDEDKENGPGRTKSGQKVVTTTSTLNLVDLAGSESVRVTGAKGERQKEGGKINQSLLTLSRVLAKLGRKERGHIGYRDSKLTRILKPSLSGNARMGCICCISPEMQYAEESKSTLDFASRTMLVTTDARSNQTVEYDDALIEGYEREIERFKLEASQAEESRLRTERALQEAEDQLVCLRASVELETSKVSTLERQNRDQLTQLEELKAVGDDKQNLLKEVEELKACVTHYEAANGRLKTQLQQDRDSFRQEREVMDEDRTTQAEKHRVEVETLTKDLLQCKQEKEGLETAHEEVKEKLAHSQKLETLSAVNADKNDELQGQVAELERKNKVLLEELEQVKADNQASQEEIAALMSAKATLSEEKMQIEWKLAREMQKSKKRKDEAKERRQRFKGKLEDMAATMKGSLKEDLVKASYEKDF